MGLVFAYLADDLVMAFSGCGARDQFGLALAGVTADAELLGSFPQFGHRPIVVGARFTAPASDVGSTPYSGRVGDAGGLFFGITLLPQFRVDLRS
jgi:hypothetical protein